MVLVPVLLAPVVVAVASAVERRLGATAAGWVAALPVAYAVSISAVGMDLGDRAAAIMAFSGAGHVAAQVTFAVCFVAALRRRGLLVGLFAGATGFALASLVLAGIPALAAVAVAIPALVVGPRLVLADPATATAHRRRCDVALGCAVAALIVGAAVLASRQAGPVAAGIIAAFPTMSATVAISIGRAGGTAAAARALQGLVRSLPCYLVFCVLIAVAGPSLGLLPAVAAAAAAATATGPLTWRAVRPRSPTRRRRPRPRPAAPRRAPASARAGSGSCC